jgi:hypothetical protein
MKHGLVSIFLLVFLLAACSASTSGTVSRATPTGSAATPDTASRATPTGSAPAPKFVNHKMPAAQLDFKAFESAGCPPDEYRNRPCQENGPLYALGCDRISESFQLGALNPAYPIVLCVTDRRASRDAQSANIEYLGGGNYAYSPQGEYFFSNGGMLLSLSRYVIAQDNRFVLIKTEDELRQLFAPLETADEALAYVQAATGLSELTDLKFQPDYDYFVDTIEDSHADQVADGYLVYLYHKRIFGCGSHPTSLVTFHVTPEGIIQQQEMKQVFKNRAEDGMCVD